jgi:NAD(P)-dependent dehydrogenase (short-subunit alcohol dehydrogenase family)
MANSSAAAGTAVVVGVGAEVGLGAALCKRLGREGLHVFVAGRTPERLAQVAAAIVAAGGRATAATADTTKEADVVQLFERAEAAGPIEVAVYNAGNNQIGNFIEMEAAFFEQVWRVACFGGFLVGREAARRMVPRGRGSILFTGATASIRARPPFVAFASAKAGLRAIAQGMAREFGPQGVHVAHVIIDGGIDGERLRTIVPAFADSKGVDGLLDIDAIADTFWQLHVQHRTAWTHELDLRPFKEQF